VGRLLFAEKVPRSQDAKSVAVEGEMREKFTLIKMFDGRPVGSVLDCGEAAGLILIDRGMAIRGVQQTRVDVEDSVDLPPVKRAKGTMPVRRKPKKSNSAKPRRRQP